MTEHNNEGFISLYIAIFRQALRHDLVRGRREFKKRVTYEITNTEGIAKTKLINKLFDEKYNKKLEEIIRNKIYEETLVWPDRDIKKEHEAKSEKIRLEREFIGEYLELSKKPVEVRK